MKLSSLLPRLGVMGLLAISVSCGKSAEHVAGTKVIYGDDNRHDIFEFTEDDAMKEAARSTAALISKSDLKDEGDGFSRMETVPYGVSMGLCKSEPFFNQPTGPWCSGFLVAPDILVTAGHCVRSESSCKDTAFVFGFGYEESDADIAKISADNTYGCKALVKRELGGSKDFAIIQLDRPVLDRKPLKVRKEGNVTKDDEVTVIGHPSGLPTKITSKGAVRSIDNADYFVTNLDTYGGNSGSAVFNSKTGEVEGILVRGENDFIYGPDGCRISNHCTSDSCRGEDVSRASMFVPFIPAVVEEVPAQ